VTAIEVNGTFYRLQTRETFAKWRDETPEDFIFSIKAPRHIVSRRNLAEGSESIQRFVDSGLAELGAKLGPILWQLPPTKMFAAAEARAFLRILPSHAGSTRLRHAVEVRHESFRCPEYLAIAREFDVATVFTHDDKYPQIADLTGNFVYARLRQAVTSEPAGYPPPALSAWAARASAWASGREPDDLPRVGAPSNSRARDVFIFFINGAKERAPAAARHLIALLDRTA
jgi:uncharacterized protein YecE (DUF72 family)